MKAFALAVFAACLICNTVLFSLAVANDLGSAAALFAFQIFMNLFLIISRLIPKE